MIAITIAIIYTTIYYNKGYSTTISIRKIKRPHNRNNNNRTKQQQNKEK